MAPHAAVKDPADDTKTRILRAASELFSRGGFDRTTVADICQQAGANLAAVNYHFQSKDNLYAEVWHQTLSRELALNPPDGGVPAQAPALDRLAGRIHSLVHRFVGPDRPRMLAMLITHELSRPTATGERVRREAVRPIHHGMRLLIHEVLGEHATERDVLFTATSIVHQCLGLGLLQQSLYRRDDALPAADGQGPGPGALLRHHVRTPQELEALVDHITGFSLAGVAHMRQQIAARRADATAEGSRR